MRLLKSEGAPQPRYYIHLLGIVAALMLGGCASDFPNMAMRRTVLKP